MQKVAFTRFGVGRGQEGAANLGAAEFQVSSKGCEVGALKASHSASCDKMALSQGVMQGKATNSAACATNGGEIHGAKGVEFAAAQGKATNGAARAVQSVAKMGAWVINSTPSKAANSVFRGLRAVFALSRARVINSARVSSLSLSLSRSLFGAFGVCA